MSQRLQRLGGIVLIGLALAGPCAAQFPDPRYSAGNLSLPVSPDLTSALIIAEQAIAAQDWERAVEILQLVVESGEDAFVSPNDPRSIQGRALEAIGRLPPEGRALYERSFSAAADGLLAELEQSGDRRRLQDLVRQYFHTPAGRTATWKLARLRQDQGASLGAAILYSKLLNDAARAQQFGEELRIRAAAAWLAAGVESQAQRQLDALASRGPGPVLIGGQPVPLPADGIPTLEWLRGVVNGGAGSETIPAEANPAPSLRWPPFLPPTGEPEWFMASVCTDEVLANYPDRADTLNARVVQLEREQRKQAVESDRVLIPATSPLVARNRVLFRGPDRLTALSISGGELLWTGTPVDFTYRELAEKSEFSEREEMTRDLYLGQRAWRDEISAAISTDSERAYTIMDCGMIGVVDPGNPLQIGRHGKGAFRDNSLQAYALGGGKLRWSIGGPVTPQDDPFAGMFFLGPPLPHEGTLYCLVEERGQVRLLAIDPAAAGGPELLWSQGLLNPSPAVDFEYHEGRRTAALQPVARGQVLICPTGAGSVVAVDLVERRLLWGTAYDEPAMNVPRFARRPPRVQRSIAERQRIALDRLLDADRWRKTEALWIGDRVLVTTPDADTLACLRVSDGKLLWDVPRDEWLFVAGCREEQVVLVGTNSIGALRLSDGQEAWNRRLPITTPNGHGFAHGNHYTLPLTSGEMITFELRTGQLLARSPLENSTAVGNLIAAEGRLISQSASGITGFASLSERPDVLAAASNLAEAEPQTLALAGEALLHAGETAKGIECLRMALQRDNTERSRLVLAAVLSEQLRTDYAAHREHAAEVERLVAETSAELSFRRLMATKCREHGDLHEAFRHLLLLGTLADENQPVEPVDDDLSVALDRWIAAGVADLLAGAETADRAAMQAQLQQEFTRLRDLDEPQVYDRLRRLSVLLRGMPGEEAVELTLARRSKDAEPAERMRRWLAVLERNQTPHRGEAIVQLAELCLACQDAFLAAPYVDMLRTEFSDQLTTNGLNGAEQLARWDEDANLGRVLKSVPPLRWPSETLKVSAERANSVSPQFHVLPVIGPIAGPLAGWTFTFDDQRQQIGAYTPLGVLAWESLAAGNRQPLQAIPLGVMIDGPLVTVFWPDQLQVISAITRDGGKSRPIRTSRSLSALTEEENAIFPQRGRMDRAGISGPLTRDLICYQLGSILVGFDPWTDRDLWRRVQPGGVSEILGDDDAIVVKTSARADLLVLRPLDGSVVATRPPVDDHLTPPEGTHWGRRMLTLVSIDDDSDRLGMYDPATDRPAWSRTLKSPVYWTAVAGETLLVIDGSLDCVQLEPATGREISRVRLPIAQPEERLLRSLTAFADADHVYLCLNDPPDSNVLQFEQQRAMGRTVNGTLCAIDRRSGKLAWSTAIAGQYVDPQQPSGWPVLVLASRQKQPDEGEFRSVQSAIDKRTGEVVFEDRQILEGLPRDFRRRASWQVDATGPIIRIRNDMQMLLIRPGAPQSETDR